MNELLQKIKNLFQKKEPDKQSANLTNKTPEDLVKNFSLSNIPAINLKDNLFKNITLPTKSNEPIINVNRTPEQVKSIRDTLIKAPEPQKQDLPSALTDFSKNLGQGLKQAIEPTLDVLINLPSKGVGALISGKAGEIIKEAIKEPQKIPEIYEKTPTAYEAISSKLEDKTSPLIAKGAGFLSELFIPTLLPLKLAKEGENLADLAKEISKISKESDVYKKLLNYFGDVIDKEIFKKEDGINLVKDLAKMKNEKTIENKIKDFISKNKDFIKVEENVVKKTEEKLPATKEKVEETKKDFNTLAKDISKLNKPSEVYGKILNFFDGVLDKNVFGTKKAINLIKDLTELKDKEIIKEKIKKFILENKDFIEKENIEKISRLKQVLNRKMPERKLVDYDEPIKITDILKQGEKIKDFRSIEFKNVKKVSDVIEDAEKIVDVKKIKDKLEFVRKQEEKRLAKLAELKNKIKNKIELTKSKKEKELIDLVEDIKDKIEKEKYLTFKKDFEQHKKIFKDVEDLIKVNKISKEEIYDLIKKSFGVEKFKELKPKEVKIFKKEILDKLKNQETIDFNYIKELASGDKVYQMKPLYYLSKYKKVFKKLGDMPYEKIYLPLRKAFDKYSIALSSEKISFRKLIKELGVDNNISSEKIFNYLDGREVELTKNEKIVADYMRKKFDEYIEKINEIRKKIGLEPIEKRKNYITHIVLDSFRNELITKANLVKEDTLNVGKILFHDILPLKEIKNPTLLLRKDVVFPIKKDAYKIFETYITLANKSIHFDEVLNNINFVMSTLNAAPEVEKYIWNFVKRTIGYSSNTLDEFFNTLNANIIKVLKNIDNALGSDIFSRRITEKDYALPAEDIRELQLMGKQVIGFGERIAKDFVNKLFPTSKSFTNLVSRIKLLNYISFIGLNLKVLYYNLIYQPLILAPSHLKGNPVINSIKIGKEMVKSLIKFFSPDNVEKYKKIGVINDLQYLYDTGIEKGGKLSDFFLFNMKISEFINRVSVFEFSKKSFYKTLLDNKISKEVIETQIDEIAKEFSHYINFRYDIFEGVPLFQNPIGSFYSQYITFSIHSASIIFDDLKKIGNKNALKEFIEAVNQGRGAEYIIKYGSPERIALLKNFFMSTALFSGTLALSGINPIDIFGYNLDERTKEKIKDTANYIFKGFIPNQVDYLIEYISNVIDGNTYKASLSLNRLLLPATISGFEKSRSYEQILKELYENDIISYDFYKEMSSVPIPKNFVPSEVQLYRLFQGKDISEKIGISRIVKEGSLPTSKRKKDIEDFDLFNDIDFGKNNATINSELFDIGDIYKDIKL